MLERSVTMPNEMHGERATLLFHVDLQPQHKCPVSADREHALRATSRWKIAPSRREIFALCLATCVVFVTFLALFRNYAAAVDDFGDSSAYMTLASAIRHWNFEGVVVKQFWGLPYAMAALSTVTRVSDRTACLRSVSSHQSRRPRLPGFSGTDGSPVSLRS